VNHFGHLCPRALNTAVSEDGQCVQLLRIQMKFRVRMVYKMFSLDKQVYVG